MPSGNSRRPSPRERLLAAADELFYEQGVRTVGIDRVIERAGVAKASLYSAFGSKDELVRCYLTNRHAVWRERMERRLAAEFATRRERLLAVFDVLGETFAEPGFHGCPFINASAEARPGSPVEVASDEYRTWIHALLVELGTAAGANDPVALARQLVLLYDGATVAARMDRSPDVAATARAAAAVVIDAATSD